MPIIFTMVPKFPQTLRKNDYVRLNYSVHMNRSTDSAECQ